MKHLTTLLLLCAAALSCRAAHRLFSGQRTDYAIVLAADASVSERTAATELQQLLRDIGGAELPIVHDAADGTAPHHVFVGWSALSGLPRPAADDEGYTYLSRGADIHIVGGSERGTMYGVYAFLERELGVHWLTSSCTSFRPMKRYTFGRLYHSEHPTFASRLDFCCDALRHNDWAAHNRLNAQNTVRTGDYGRFHAYWRAHTFHLLMPADRYFSQHPEYYSLYQGQRAPDKQLCLSNEAMRRELTKNLLEVIAQTPGYWCYDVSQNDNRHPCECGACQQLASLYGGQSGAMIWFVNKVAAEVEKQYPDVLIGTFAYQYTRHAPTSSIRPARNVVVRLCNIECCMAHPLDACQQNQDFISDLEAWRQKTDRIYIWDYTTGFLHYLLPFPNFTTLASNYQLFSRSGVMGILEEGAHDALWSEFSELKQWLVAQLLWNPRQDVDSLARVFIDAYYRSAAPHVRQYYALCRRQVTADSHFSIHIDWRSPLYTDRFIDDGEALLAKARAAATAEADVQRRIARLEAQLCYLRLRRNPAQAAADGTTQRLRAILDDDPTIVREGGQTLDKLLESLKYY